LAALRKEEETLRVTSRQEEGHARLRDGTIIEAMHFAIESDLDFVQLAAQVVPYSVALSLGNTKRH